MSLFSHWVRHNRYPSVDFTLCVAKPLPRFRARLQKDYDVCADKAPVAYVLFLRQLYGLLGLHIQGEHPSEADDLKRVLCFRFP